MVFRFLNLRKYTYESLNPMLQYFKVFPILNETESSDVLTLMYEAYRNIAVFGRNSVNLECASVTVLQRKFKKSPIYQFQSLSQ